jgi:hypothetical protein
VIKEPAVSETAATDAEIASRLVKLRAHKTNLLSLCSLRGGRARWDEENTWEAIKEVAVRGLQRERCNVKDLSTADLKALYQGVSATLQKAKHKISTVMGCDERRLCLAMPAIFATLEEALSAADAHFAIIPPALAIVVESLNPISERALRASAEQVVSDCASFKFPVPRLATKGA